MRLSTLLLIIIFVFSCLRLTARTAWRLCINEGTIAAGSLLLLALSAFPVSISEGFSLSPASLLLLVAGLWLCRGAADIFEALLAALLGGLLGWCLNSMTTIYEPGLLIALPSAILPAFFFRRKRTGLLAAIASPLLFGICQTLEEWYLFDLQAISLGGGIQLDAQIAAMFLLAILWYIPHRQRTLNRSTVGIS